MMNFRNLFKPITINGLFLKNRLVMSALHHGYTPNGFATPRFNKYYWRRAEGGAGLIIVGGCVIDNYRGYADIMSLESDDYILGYREFTKGIHKRGAKVAVQLMHTGRYSRTKYITGDKDYRHAYILVFEHIETFYNTTRIHSQCNYMSPNKFEKAYEKCTSISMSTTS